MYTPLAFSLRFLSCLWVKAAEAIHQESGFTEVSFSSAGHVQHVLGRRRLEPTNGSAVFLAPSVRDGSCRQWQQVCRARLMLLILLTRRSIGNHNSSPSSNPHAGFHPSSFGHGMSYTAAALGATSSTVGSSSFGMSISPPHWAPNNTPWGTSGSFVGSLGALGTSFGRERDRELEAKYVQDFTCCGRQLNGLHDLLEQ